ncbi:hypothetical protein C7B67_08490 [filamentous cyanobacterium Phorm 6]|nr:hypothetical protein C7B67_08490 [filamentous cyanobacterium Phorm 6]
MYECKITLGKTITNARQQYGFSQRELCQLLVTSDNSINHHQLAKIENNRVDVRSDSYDWLISKLAEVFSCDVVWLEQIRQQTEIEHLDSSKTIFPIYFN